MVAIAGSACPPPSRPSHGLLHDPVVDVARLTSDVHLRTHGESAVANGVASDALPLLKGTLDLLVLKTLSWTEMHGFGISSWLERQSGGALTVDDSALYQALHRLEERGHVSARWGMTENNRRARYYRLTT